MEVYLLRFLHIHEVSYLNIRACGFDVRIFSRSVEWNRVSSYSLTYMQLIFDKSAKVVGISQKKMENKPMRGFTTSLGKCR